MFFYKDDNQFKKREKYSNLEANWILVDLTFSNYFAMTAINMILIKKSINLFMTFIFEIINPVIFEKEIS